jgi:hypothetical protein
VAILKTKVGQFYALRVGQFLALISKHQPRRLQAGHLGPPSLPGGRYVGAVLLGGPEDFF